MPCDNYGHCTEDPLPGQPSQTPAPAPGANPTPGANIDYNAIDTTISKDQWKAWDSFLDPNCPPDKPFKSERGSPGCFEKPVDCPPGQGPSGPQDGAPCTSAGYSGAGGGGKGGGGGGGGGGVGSAFGAAGFFDPAKGMSKVVGSQIAQIMAGGTRFSPEVMARLAAQGKLQQQSSIAGQTEALNQNLASRGLATSPAGATLEAGIQANAAQSYDQFIQNTEIQKAVTDFEDKLKGISLGLSWMKDLRSYYLGLDSNAVQREGIAANLELGYARIKAEMDMLMQNLASRKDLLGMELDSREWQTTQQLIMCMNLGQC